MFKYIRSCLRPIFCGQINFARRLLILLTIIPEIPSRMLRNWTPPQSASIHHSEPPLSMLTVNVAQNSGGRGKAADRPRVVFILPLVSCHPWSDWTNSKNITSQPFPSAAPLQKKERKRSDIRTRKASLAMEGLQAIKYKRGSLEVLDQLRLPHEFVYEDVTTCEEAFDCIKSMRVRGELFLNVRWWIQRADVGIFRCAGHCYRRCTSYYYFIFFQVAYFWFEVICAVLEEWLCANVTPEYIQGWDFETADVYERKCSVWGLASFRVQQHTLSGTYMETTSAVIPWPASLDFALLLLRRYHTRQGSSEKSLIYL